jgi:hypothetical protein
MGRSPARQRPAPPGVVSPPIVYTDNVDRVIRALQAQIQEMILAEAQVDRDVAVPPQYKTLVDDYYRALSEDLR